MKAVFIVEDEGTIAEFLTKEPEINNDPVAFKWEYKMDSLSVI